MDNIKYIKEHEKISDYFKPEDLTPNGEGCWKALSPFQKETVPSFFINTVNGVELFKDFSSGNGGDIFSFLQKTERKSFIEIYSELAEKHGLIEKAKKKKNVNKEYYDILSNLAFYFNQKIKEKSEVVEYLNNRNITMEDIDYFNLGWVDDSMLRFTREQKIEDAKLLDLGLLGEGENNVYSKLRNRITIPLYNEQNQIIGISTRKFLEADTSGKYINPTNNALYKKNSYLYGFNLSKDSIKELDYVIICEGYFDFIQLYKNGFQNSVCVCGTSLMSEHVKKISKYTSNFYFCFDGDVAGDNSIMKNAKEVIKQGFNINIIELPEGYDPDDFLQKTGKEEFKSKIRNSKTILEYISLYEEKMIILLEDLKSIIPKISSSVRKQLWYKNIIDSCGINLEKDLKQEFFKKKQEEPLTENDIIFIKTFINSDEEGQSILLKNKFYNTDKAKYLILKLTNKIYNIPLSKDELKLIESFKLNKVYKKEDIDKILKRKAEEKLFNENK